MLDSSATEQVKNRYLPTINHRTTVVIPGYGRNNGKHPNPQALEEIAQHAKQLVWITPEPKLGWFPGSCDMLICNRAEVVRILYQPDSVAEELVESRV